MNNLIAPQFETCIKNIKQLQEAKAYISYGVKEGFISEDAVENMTDEEIINFAEASKDKADTYVDVLKEEDL